MLVVQSMSRLYAMSQTNATHTYTICQQYTYSRSGEYNVKTLASGIFESDELKKNRKIFPLDYRNPRCSNRWMVQIG